MLWLSDAIGMDRQGGAAYPAYEVDIHLSGILLELQQDLVDVLVAGQADHDLQLLHLHIDGIVVLAEEHLQARKNPRVNYTAAVKCLDLSATTM